MEVVFTNGSGVYKHHTVLLHRLTSLPARNEEELFSKVAAVDR